MFLKELLPEFHRKFPLSSLGNYSRGLWPSMYFLTDIRILLDNFPIHVFEIYEKAYGETPGKQFTTPPGEVSTLTTVRL